MAESAVLNEDLSEDGMKLLGAGNDPGEWTGY